jgi:hypothetical protein
MADRADYIARTIMTRLAHLQASFAEDGRGQLDRRQRIAAVEKVLAIELGITDGITAASVEAAAPNIAAIGRGGLDRERTAFAAFLRERVIVPDQT